MPMNSLSSRSAISFTSLGLVRPSGHWSNGFRGTKNSATKDPSGSVASSPRPCSETTVSAHGERQDDPIEAADPAHQPGLDLVDPFGEQDRGQNRRHREGGDDRAD